VGNRRFLNPGGFEGKTIAMEKTKKNLGVGKWKGEELEVKFG
jgi:hypothetical protein